MSTPACLAGHTIANRNSSAVMAPTTTVSCRSAAASSEWVDGAVVEVGAQPAHNSHVGPLGQRELLVDEPDVRFGRGEQLLELVND